LREKGIPLTIQTFVKTDNIHKYVRKMLFKTKIKNQKEPRNMPASASYSGLVPAGPPPFGF